MTFSFRLHSTDLGELDLGELDLGELDLDEWPAAVGKGP
jgi:hypothetical protein